MSRSLATLGMVMMMLLLPHVRGQQPITFDTAHFSQIGSFAIGDGVFQVDSGYLCLSQQRGILNPSQDLYTLLFNEQGGLLTERNFHRVQQDDIGWTSGASGLDGNIYLGLATGGVISTIDSLFLYKLNRSGDTLWTRFVGADTSVTNDGIAIEPDGDVLLSGRHDPGRNAYIYHIDSMGAVKGFHLYPDFDANDVAIGDVGRWYLAGIGNTLSNYSRAVIIGSDTNGSETWRDTDWSMYGRYTSLVSLEDSGVVAMGSRNPLDSCQRCTVSKFSRTGNLVWRKDPYRTDYHNWYCTLQAGYETDASDIIAAGRLRDSTHRDAGILMKLDQNGDTIWTRFYSHYPGASYGKDQIFYDVKPTSDGGMVLTGETNSDAYPYAQLWLLKLDSMGCLVPGCQYVGLQELTDAYVNALIAFPNPSTGAFTLELDLPANAPLTGDLLLQVFDMQGRQVVARGLGRDRYQRIALDLANEPAGLYSAHLSDGRRILTGVRLVRE